MSTKIKYSDINFTFGRNPISSDVDVRTNNYSIKQSMKNIILTRKKERPFRLNFGVNIADQLFENYDSRYSSEFYHVIKDQLEAFVSRIDVNHIIFDDSKINENLLGIEIQYEYVVGFESEKIQDSLKLQIERIR